MCFWVCLPTRGGGGACGRSWCPAIPPSDCPWSAPVGNLLPPGVCPYFPFPGTLALSWETLGLSWEEGRGRYGLLPAASTVPAGFFSQRTAAIASSASLSQHIINTWKPFKYRNLS